MALHNRDYMGGAAPPLGSGQGFDSPWRAYRVLIAINLVVFVISLTSVGRGFLVDHALVSSQNLAAGRYWVLLFGGFLHLDVVHLVLALGFVYILGWRLEQERGPKVLVLLYLLGSLAVGGVSLYANRERRLPFAGEDQTGTGTGFVVATGHLLTNAHVVGKTERLEVERSDGAKIEGRVVARNEELDLALVEAATQRPVLPVAPGRPTVGQNVFAIGYGSLEGNTSTQLQTRGTVSGFREDRQWLVFDGTVNPGNSGGPLVDGSGRWVGVVVAKTRRGQGEDSLGFAIEAGSAQTWLASQGVQLAPASQAPSAVGPPRPDVGSSVVRLIVRRALLPAAEQEQIAVPLLDPWLFGASGAFLAFAGFFCFAEPRRHMLVFGTPVPVLVLVGFASVADLAGALRTYHNFYSWAHLHHALAIPVGIATYVVYKGKLGVWLRELAQRRKQARFKVLQGGGEGEVSGSKLSLADRARLDRILEKVGNTGMASLSPEEREFLERTSGKLRGE